MCQEITRLVKELPLPPTEKFILWAIADRIPEPDESCSPTDDALSRDTGHSMHTICLAVRHLQKSGLLVVTRHDAGLQHVSTEYRVNMAVLTKMLLQSQTP